MTAGKLAIAGQILPYIMKVGSPAFRRKLAEWTPTTNVQNMKRSIDIFDETSKGIYAKKKEAFTRGDEAVVNQIGQGKDIMSILSE